MSIHSRGEGENRTRVHSLCRGGHGPLCHFAVEQGRCRAEPWIRVVSPCVEMTGFEPATGCLQSRCTTVVLHPRSASRRTRTFDQRYVKPLLLPLSYRRVASPRFELGTTIVSGSRSDQIELTRRAPPRNRTLSPPIKSRMSLPVS